MSTEVYILAGCRTPIGKFKGQFQECDVKDLGSTVVKEAVARASITAEDVDEVIIGQVLTAGQGQNPARHTSLKAGMPKTTPAFTLNMTCNSALKAIFLGYQAIRSGDTEIVVAGGQENMSRAHHSALTRGNRSAQYKDTMLIDGLTDALHNVHMGITAEHLASKFNISRESQDKYAISCRKKTRAAIESGYFEKEIVPVLVNGNMIDEDEVSNVDVTLEDLAELATVFDDNGSVTAGNASPLNDGAAAVVLCGEQALVGKNLEAMARIVAFGQVALEPMEMGLASVGAIEKVLEKSGWTKDEVDLYELNEAFAVQAIAVLDALQLNLKKVNISGGSLVLGHPIGCSGSRIVVTLMHNLERLGKKKGIASLCAGGGLGIAIAIEMLP